ncbi:MAG TPA: hypothetical protein V6D29_12640 [Leptolyngbyaceae cyanobacterium]
MKYLVAVLANREQAESAANALKSSNSAEDVSIIGEGYDSTEGLGIIDPPNQARIRARQISYWVMSIGFIGAVAFSWINGVEIIPNAAAIINYSLAGILGSLLGALISFLVGGPLGWTNSGDALSFYDRVDSGKYVVTLKADAKKVQEASRALGQFKPEKVQFFEVAPTKPQDWTNRPTAFE